MDFFIRLVAGTVTGIITGFGIGGGTLLILYLTMFCGSSQINAQGINLIYFLPTAGSALITHIKNRRVVLRAVIYAGASGVLAAILASVVVSGLDMTLLRRIFGGFLILVGISELFAKRRNHGE